MSMKPGIYPLMTNAEYHADPALGSTSMKTLALRTPAHWKWESEHPVHKDVYDIGTLAHSLILEGDESAVAVIDVPDKRGKKWADPADEARDAGRVPVTSAEWEGIKGMRDAVMAHPIASQLFTGHVAEQSVFHDDNGLMVKVRPDAYKSGQLVDLKTTNDASPNEFGQTAFNFGYFISAAMYRDVWKAATGEECTFTFVNVEKTKPYLVSVVQLDDDAIEYGMQMIIRAKAIYKECMASGVWPGYPLGEPVSLPMYANYQLDDLLGLNIETEITF